MNLLTTSRAIVLAAVLATCGLGAHTLLPRYEIRTLHNGAAFARVDRWTGTVATALRNEHNRAAWLTIEPTGDWFTDHAPKAVARLDDLIADPVADTLRAARTSDPVRADAWDAFYNAADADDLAIRLKAIPLPDDAKAELWVLKYGITGGLDPKRAAQILQEEAKRRSDAVNTGQSDPFLIAGLITAREVGALALVAAVVIIAGWRLKTRQAPRCQMEPNPQRPTETWKLWALGGGMGVVVSVLVFMTSWSSGDAAARVEGFRKIGMGALLFLALMIAGGWSALRRGEKGSRR